VLRREERFFVLAIEVCRLRGLCLGKGFKETAWHFLPSIAISHDNVLLGKYIVLVHSTDVT